MLSAHTNLIEGEDGTFPEKSLSYSLFQTQDVCFVHTHQWIMD